ncbi:hypothetical protein WCU55_06525 [Pectobacterium carotovorum]|nr:MULTISPECIES: hypothetical protein [Pectobacterium]MCY9850407.1 hypothetical protein [Pectobacterium jejuense]
MLVMLTESAFGTERTESEVTKHLEQRRLVLQWWANFLDATATVWLGCLTVSGRW